jgi:hypothetical protein
MDRKGLEMYYRTYFIIEKNSRYVVKGISLGQVVKLETFDTLDAAKEFVDSKRKDV